MLWFGDCHVGKVSLAPLTRSLSLSPPLSPPPPSLPGPPLPMPSLSPSLFFSSSTRECTRGLSASI